MTTQYVWDKYSEDLKQFIISKVKNEVIADDILQESFMKIHAKLHTLKEVSKLKSWVFSITRNSIMDYFRATNNKIEITHLEPEIEQEISHEHTEKDCLLGILKNLPKKYRDPLFLSDIRGLKQSEIAKQLNIPLPTVKSQIQRARKQIAKGFMDCCGFVMNTKGHLVGEIQEKENCKVCKN